MGNTQHHSLLQLIAPGFWNIRGRFKIFGLVNIGTQMSVIKLSNDKYLIVDTVPLDDETRDELDTLTEKGTLIEAVLATHPFHTLAFPDFFQHYPNAPYYGCPRHLRTLPQIPWVGSFDDPEILRKWEPEVEMRIPAGAEFVNPLPESSNHFVSVWVYSRLAKTVHVDDTVCYLSDPPMVLQLLGIKKDTLFWHTSMLGPAFYPTPEAPQDFRRWVEDLLNDWDFDNFCIAHKNNMIGGAREALREALDRVGDDLNRLSEERRIQNCAQKRAGGESADWNVKGNECG
eukprot:TRINITY_DN8870_c0_g1_i2.p1 TRINITY_DN8870_c0_g1~~TRINITY_DN8870_c0_g1_i2.p1  ORF type:complete len:287 (+),score=38.01 TRINITY_DN8870_c0_g1_i2:822-1682(+)